MPATFTRSPRGTITTNHNYSPNPQVDFNTTDWLFNAVSAGATSGRTVGNFTSQGLPAALPYFWVQWANPTAGPAGAYTPNASVAQGGVVTHHSVYVWTTRAMTMRLSMHYDNGAAELPGDPVQLAAQTWTRLHMADTAVNAGGARLVISNVPELSSWQAGDVLAVTRHCVTWGDPYWDYFDGDTPASGDRSYSWDGPAGNSTSSLKITDARSQFTPELLLIHKQDRTVRNVVHDIINRAAPEVTLKPAGLRSGTLRLLFGSDFDAFAAEDAFAQLGAWRLDDTDTGYNSMNFVTAGGQLHLEQIEDTDSTWQLDVPFQETA